MTSVLIPSSKLLRRRTSALTTDLLGVVVTAALAAFIMLVVSPADESWLSLVVWVLCAGVVVGRRRSLSLLPLPVWWQFGTPLLALGASWLSVKVLGAGNTWPLLALSSLLWALWRVGAQLSLPHALRLGVYAPGGRLPSELPAAPHEDLIYVSLDPQRELALAHLDAVVINYRAPQTDVAGQQPFSYADAQRLTEHASAVGLPLWSLVNLQEELSGQVSLEHLNSAWISGAGIHSRYEAFKRGLDILFTVLALPLLLPIMLVVAALVWLNGRRPVLFWQERVGRGGAPFRIVKFRTMRLDSERSGPAFASTADSRVTPLGAWLRKFRLDELPQFWNVLRGEMSIIGPRPEQWAFAADFEESLPLYPLRHWVRPGITGWAQVNQGYAADLGQTIEKLRYDLYYVKHLSLPLDIAIVLKTVYAILTGFGAR